MQGRPQGTRIRLWRGTDLTTSTRQIEGTEDPPSWGLPLRTATSQPGAGHRLAPLPTWPKRVTPALVQVPSTLFRPPPGHQGDIASFTTNVPTAKTLYPGPTLSAATRLLPNHPGNQWITAGRLRITPLKTDTFTLTSPVPTSPVHQTRITRRLCSVAALR